ADLAGAAAGIGAQIFAQQFGLAQDGARVLEKRAAGLGRDDALARAHQQRGAKRLLHVADARGSCGQCEMRPLGPAGDASGFHHVTKQAQIGEVEAHGLPSSLAKESYAKYRLSAKSPAPIFAIDEMGWAVRAVAAAVHCDGL